MSIEVKKQLVDAVIAFQKPDFYKNGLNLFNTLGYNTNRTMPLEGATYKSFNAEFEAEKQGFNKKAALTGEWKEIQLLFQLTSDDMAEQLPMFQPTINRDEPASFLFFGIDLKGENYTRSALAAIAREVNKPFKMDVFLLFKYGQFLTLSLIERRPNKKIYDRDVIEKVTHVYNVNIAKPHSAHIHILHSFSLEAIEVSEKRRTKLENFNDLQRGWKKIVNTQILNRQFYKDYQELSVMLIKAIHPAQVTKKMIAHQGVLNLLNRIMFVYFVQKKKWIMDDENFILNFWYDYLKEGLDGTNQFHEKWLNSIFFSAFNGKAYKEPKALAALPEPYKSALIYFPYLNGGLFTFHKDLDDFLLPDTYFHAIFKFFEGYIFTITEDTPYDVNLEINPELLGKMYEGMINATDLDDVDAEHGIIYTERPEINFMVRRSFVEVLDKKLNTTQTKAFSREFLYHFIFDTPEEKLLLLKKSGNDIMALRKAIASLTACDPACGSGSMILGVIQLQMELLRCLDAFMGKPHTPKDDFAIKKQLISECIYGVDIKEWAVRIAELRLWLYMIAEAVFNNDELTKEPLLPNLDFKLRQGNSLLQIFGNLNFTVEELFKGKQKTTGAAHKLHAYIKKKKEFIVNQSSSKDTYDSLKQEEKAVFLDLIQEMIREKEKAIGNRKARQGSIFGGGVTQNNLFEEETAQFKGEIEQLKKLRQFIYKEKRMPFSFDIDFMEIFLVNESDPGFDLVIGNPPYVRQEQILPPEDGEYLEMLMKPEKKIEKARVNKAYKEELNKKVYDTFQFLEAKQTIRVKKEKVFRQAGKKVTREVEVDEKIAVYGTKVPGRADLYVYFQLIAPKYLNSQGTFCFIISNSWLDVDFGSYIQHFLLKHTQLYAVYDCNVRSFEAAVNTVIYLHGSVQKPAMQGGKSGLYKLASPVDNTCRFVMNKIDYTQAAYAPMLIDQEGCRQNSFNDYYRCIPVSQEQLYTNGYDEEERQYAGDKWGGKNLRAPEIYYKILEKGNGKLTKLKDVANVKFGIKTGANDFFILDKETTKRWDIEDEYLLEFLTSPKDIVSLSVNNKQLSYFLFKCTKTKKELNGTNALRYIQWGEQSEIINGNENRAFHLRPSCQGRTNWYSIEKKDFASINCNYMVGELMKFFHGRVAVVNNFHEVHCDEAIEERLSYILNSTISQLFLNVIGRKSLGDGLMKIEAYELADVIIVNPSFFNPKVRMGKAMENRPLNDLFCELGFKKEVPIRSVKPNPLPDRKVLDDVIFDELNLTADERNEVYWSVAELVKQRMDKAASR